MDTKEFNRKLKQLEKIADKISKFNKKHDAEYSAIKKELAKDCPHPPAYVKDYRWEHDNGYGSQHMRTGKRCSLCDGKDAWETGRFYKPEDFRD